MKKWNESKRQQPDDRAENSQRPPIRLQENPTQTHFYTNVNCPLQNFIVYVQKPNRLPSIFFRTVLQNSKSLW